VPATIYYVLEKLVLMSSPPFPSSLFSIIVKLIIKRAIKSENHEKKKWKGKQYVDTSSQI